MFGNKASILLSAIVLSAFATACSAHGPQHNHHRGHHYQNQPAMQAALHHLRMARKRLIQASPTKGGHRARAIELTNRAIRQTRKGIAYDNRH